jgi:transcriptional accessory protein Tex/SPT6
LPTADGRTKTGGRAAADDGQKLDELLAARNAEKGNRRIDAMANVISELVNQRKQVREELGPLHARMMAHMMEHMQSGTTAMLAGNVLLGELGVIGAPPQLARREELA